MRSGGRDIKVKFIFLNRTLNFCIHIMPAYAETNTMTYDIISFPATKYKKVNPKKSDIRKVSQKSNFAIHINENS